MIIWIILGYVAFVVFLISAPGQMTFTRGAIFAIVLIIAIATIANHNDNDKDKHKFT